MGASKTTPPDEKRGNAPTQFADEFRQSRRRRRLTQRDAAERLGIQQQTVARWESGASTPQARLLSKVAGFLEVDETDLKQWISGPARTHLRLVLANDGGGAD